MQTSSLWPKEVDNREVLLRGRLYSQDYSTPPRLFIRLDWNFLFKHTQEG